MPAPRFFVDRSLGRRQVPTLLREDGWDLVTLAEHYGIPADERVPDVAWLQLAGERSWPVLMKDERIRYRPAERAALLRHGVRAFCLTLGNLTGREMSAVFIRHRDQIQHLATAPSSALFALSLSAVREVDLTD